MSPQEFRLLEGLRLNPRKSFAGRVRGERTTQKRGISIEFADHREYVEGDDLRHLDWNVLARLDTPTMKTYRDEEDLAVHLLVDSSPSMTFGEPTKLSAAMRWAAALGLVALAGGDAVYPHALGRREGASAPWRGRASYPRLARWLTEIATDSTPDRSLAASVLAFAGSSSRTGLAILLTDGLDRDLPQALRALASRGHEILLVQVLSDEEIDPDLEGDLRLIDVESEGTVEITVNGLALREYRRRLDAHNASLAEAVRRGGGRATLLTNHDTLESLLRGDAKREGWLVR